MRPADMCLHELFEEQARRTPRALAVEDTGTRLTYEELDGKADLLASYLRDAGAGPGELVDVYMERRAEYVVACLAAMKAGAAYLILELAYPPSLLRDVVADSEPRLVLTQERYAGNLPAGTARLCLDEGWEEGIEATQDGAPPSVDREDPAFVSYSSGTTGKPKGITNPHRAAVRSYQWRFGLSDYGPGDRVGCNVFFIWEMLRPLLRGATTMVIPDDVIYDPGALTRFLEEFGITETLMTPSLLETVLDASGPDLAERLSALRVLWLNGEVVTKTLARRVLSLLPETRVLNVYSCSETHEVAAGDLRELSESPDSTYCPVGRPMYPDLLYMVDDDANRVPDREAGELCVGGDCLARGYLGLPEKTDESFPPIPSPPQKTPGCTAPGTRRASCPTATSRYWAARTSWSRSGATASSWGRWWPPSGRASPSGPASSSPMGRRARTSASSPTWSPPRRTSAGGATPAGTSTRGRDAARR